MDFPLSIQDWGAVGEIVGAIGIILTLIYLTTQIRQNTRQIRNEGHIGITDSYNEIIAQLLADDVLFRLVVLGCHDWENLSAFEKSRFHLFYHQHLTHFRMAARLHDEGAIDDDVYQTIEDLHINSLANPGARVWWSMVGESVVEEGLRSRINDLLDTRIGTNQATTEAFEFYDPKHWRDPDGA